MLVGPSNFTVNVVSRWLVTPVMTGALGVVHEQKHGFTALAVEIGLEPKSLLAEIFTV
jgi:hypothetical protein